MLANCRGHVLGRVEADDLDRNEKLLICQHMSMSETTQFTICFLFYSFYLFLFSCSRARAFEVNIPWSSSSRKKYSPSLIRGVVSAHLAPDGLLPRAAPLERAERILQDSYAARKKIPTGLRQVF